MSDQTTTSEESPFDPVEPDEHMHIDPVERNWMIVAVGVTIVFFVAVTIAGFIMIRVRRPSITLKVSDCFEPSSESQ